MKGLKAFIVGACGTALVLLLLLAAYRNWKADLYSGLSSDKIADLDTSNMTMLVFGILLVVVIVVILWAAKHQAARMDARPYADRGEVVDAPTWRELQPSQPQALIAGPRYFDLPTMRTNGKASPMGMQSQPELVLRSNADDDRGGKVAVPFRYLLRFAKCATPARNEWTGKPTIFYDCQAWFTAHGLLEPHGSTFVWSGQYPMDARVTWLESIEAQALGGARE